MRHPPSRSSDSLGAKIPAGASLKRFPEAVDKIPLDLSSPSLSDIARSDGAFHDNVGQSDW